MCYRPIESYYSTLEKKVYFSPPDTHYNVIRIPCGSCLACRVRKQGEWTARLMLELDLTLNNVFVTLTYDDEHLPSFVNFLNPETGEIEKRASLEKKALSTFLKNVRRYFEYHYSHCAIRFFGCGEYGELNNRPHFHIILLNLPNIQKVPIQGTNYYSCPELEKVWAKGFVTCGDVTYESISYVAGYILKKYGDNFIHLPKGLEKPFINYSRMPGIGYQYFFDNYEKIYKFDSLNIVAGDKVKKVRVPKYFDYLAQKHGLIDLQRVKLLRKQKAIALKKVMLSKTSLTESAYNYICEQKLIKKLEKCVKRDKMEV